MEPEKPINQDEFESPEQPTKIKEKMTDMDAVLKLAHHIDHPGKSDVEPEELEKRREFYLREAEIFLPKITNSLAKIFLESKIRQYKK